MLEKYLFSSIIAAYDMCEKMSIIMAIDHI